MRAAPLFMLTFVSPLVTGCGVNKMVSLLLHGAQHSTAPVRLPDGEWVQPEASAKELSPEQAKAILIARAAVERHDRGKDEPAAAGFSFTVFELENRGWAVIVRRGLNAEGHSVDPGHGYTVHVDRKWNVAAVEPLEEP